MPHKNDPPTVLSAYAQPLERVTQSGVEVFALDGYPEAIYEPAPLSKKSYGYARSYPTGIGQGFNSTLSPTSLAQFSEPQDYSLYLRGIDLERS